ncbi:hypothetical protein TNCV_1253011 [Trichonephila clavipes]|nr:hypothetical protein TNCV_1253011 [Trichonephila clavipes]
MFACSNRCRRIDKANINTSVAAANDQLYSHSSPSGSAFIIVHRYHLPVSTPSFLSCPMFVGPLLCDTHIAIELPRCTRAAIARLENFLS